jgi:hypothetical protein
VSAEQLALMPSATGSGYPDDGDRWQAYFDTDDELVFYCPDCAEQEFGRRRS